LTFFNNFSNDGEGYAVGGEGLPEINFMLENE